jgi:hypothetical protein
LLVVLSLPLACTDSTQAGGGIVVIPADESSAAIVVSARDTCDERESVTVTLAGADASELAGETAASVELRAS